MVLPATMRAAVLHGIREVRWEVRPVPQPTGTEALVRISAVGICASDINYVRNFQSRTRQSGVASPIVLGHEASGVVVSAAPGSQLSVGTRVALEPGVACLVCAECRSGRYNLCRDLRFFASRPTDGALQEYVVLPAHLLHPVADNVTWTGAALAEPLAVAVRACRRAGVGPGSRILITGVGAIGLLAVQVALLSGASRVGVRDPDASRVGVARGLGAEGVGESDSDREFDALIECSGATQSALDAAHLVRPGGRVVLVGIGKDPTPAFPTWVMHSRELWVTGSYRYTDDFARAVSLLNSGLLELDYLVSRVFPFEQAGDALLSAADDHSALRVMVLNLDT